MGNAHLLHPDVNMKACSLHGRRRTLTSQAI
jgi:hypothetical protein